MQNTKENARKFQELDKGKTKLRLFERRPASMSIDEYRFYKKKTLDKMSDVAIQPE